MALWRTSHVVYDTQYHLVWCPKYRKDLFAQDYLRELFRQYPSIKKRLWKGALWEDGYFARTVGDKLISDMIEKYIRHHRDEKQSSGQLGFKLR